jgi:endonuclease YncB( thermonuclease family)
MKVRLNGIGTPERKQTCRKAGVTWKCGYEATETLRGWTYTKEVRCVGDEKDRYGRSIVESIGSINTPSCHNLLLTLGRDQ